MKKLYLATLVLLALVSFLNKSNRITIPDESIRFRIIANSDTKEDQEEKILIKNVLKKEVMNDIKESTNINETRKIISNNINRYKNLIKNTLEINNRDTDFNLNFGNNYFPKKEYGGIVYKEGYYESLVVSLGNGNGKNWWCCLFPPLCLLEAEEGNKDEVEYKFFIKEIIDRYMK